MAHQLRLIAFAAVLAALIALPASAEAPTTQPDLAERNAQLQQLLKDFGARASQAELENHSLKEQLEKLKAENQKLKAQLFANGAKLNDGAAILPYRGLARPATPSAPPGSSGSFEFNGRSVYIVPLKKAEPFYRPLRSNDLDLIDDRPK